MRRLAVVLAVCLVLLAGCAGFAGDERAGAETPGDATPANAVAYGNLSPAERRAFDAAVDGGAEFFGDTRYLEGEYFDPAVARPFRAHEYVRKNGTFYELSSHDGHVVASYKIVASAGDPPGNATVVALGTLPAEVRRPVSWAIENGSYTTPLGQWNSVPDELGDAEYVRDGDRSYRLGYRVGDAWVEVWEAEKVG